MAYAYPSQRRILVPAPQLIDLATGAPILPSPAPPPPPPPLAPAGYFVVRNPAYRGPVFVVGHPPGLIAVPAAVRVDPAVLVRMEEQRNQALIQFMVREGLVPSPEEEVTRRDIVEKLKQIVLTWIKKVAWQRRLPKDVIAITNATILPYGSYGLGVHGSDSDIDALCVGPCFTTMEEDFFIVLHNMLQGRPEVSDIHCVKSAKVPLMRFKFNGVLVDFPYARLQLVSVPDNVDFVDPRSIIADETSWRSISGVSANARIRQLVPNLENFQAMLRCIKLWARRRGIYSHLLGFFGGIHLTILAALVCQRHPNGSISSLLAIFFRTFANWSWPEPVILQDRSIPYRYPDVRSLMPIMMPCFPFEWCNSNITTSTFNKIKAEFQRAYNMTKDPGRMDFDWSQLFEFFPYTRRYAHFLQIFLSAPDGDKLQDWVGWVKSRFRSLLIKLEMVQGYCDPNPTEYVEHTVDEPNVVFYWGLSSNMIDLLDVDSVKEDFMRSVNKDLDNDNRSIRTRCRLELSIVESSQLPKDVQVDSGYVKESKAYYRIFNDLDMRKPIYSQYLPGYFVGYMAPDSNRPSGAP